MIRSLAVCGIAIGLMTAMQGRAYGEKTVKTLYFGLEPSRAGSANDKAEGWETWAPRPAIAPQFTLQAVSGSERRLMAAGNGSAQAVGAWRRRIEGVGAGKTYRFTARFQAKNVENPTRSIGARLEWLDARGERARPPDYAQEVRKEAGWTEVEYVTQAPEGAVAVRLELWFAWAAQGSVTWDDMRFEEIESAPRRIVRAVTIYDRPRNTKSAAESVAAFCRHIEAAASHKPDIICLPEGITIVGNGMNYVEASEPVPGPTTERLGELAKKLRCYIVAGIFERVGEVVYNTAALIGRDGKLVGTYRKTHLPREEVEGGITPGDAYPVFTTDFGKVGLMICWDVQFPEPARAMAAQGADILLLPIWGGNDVLARARAIENHVFLITSSYDMQTFIVDPTGVVLAEASEKQPLAVAELNLDRKYIQPWLGDMKMRTWKESRPDIPVFGSPGPVKR